MIERYDIETTWEDLAVEALVEEDSNPGRECAPWVDVYISDLRLGGDPYPEALVHITEDVGEGAARVAEGYCRVMRELPPCVRRWLLDHYSDEITRSILDQ